MSKILERKEQRGDKTFFKFIPATGYKRICDDEDKKVIRCKVASFGTRDSDHDILIKGCFSKSIQERGASSSTNRKLAFLWQHDMRDPIGLPLKWEELEDGLYAEVQLSNFDAVPNAKRTWYQLEDGTLNQFSIGFQYIWDKMEYDENLDAFIVKEVKLWEASVVTQGANEFTEFMGEVSKNFDGFEESLKSMDKETLNKIKQIVEAQLAEPGDHSLQSSMFADCIKYYTN